jgi:hypothetical protein
MVGASFAQGEADIYSNPPANYQMYRRAEKKSYLPATPDQRCVSNGGAFLQGEAADVYTNPPANYQMYPRLLGKPKPAAFLEDVKAQSLADTPSTACPESPDMHAGKRYEGPAWSLDVPAPILELPEQKAKPVCAEAPYPEFGSMIGATFVQGEAADIYTNPPANYQMYPRKPAAATEKTAPVARDCFEDSSDEGKVVAPLPAMIEESPMPAMVGATFVQGEADIYTNPPANYQMYPRKPKNASTGVEEKKPTKSLTSTHSPVPACGDGDLVVGIDIEDDVAEIRQKDANVAAKPDGLRLAGHMA